MKLNKEGYAQLIEEDIEWLENNTSDTLERKHIIMVLEQSIDTYYPPKQKCSDCGKTVYKSEIDSGTHYMTSCVNMEDKK
jgi:hypothetical protein